MVLTSHGPSLGAGLTRPTQPPPGVETGVGTKEELPSLVSEAALGSSSVMRMLRPFWILTQRVWVW